MTPVEMALDYAARGLPVFPVGIRRNPRTGKLDKVPLVEKWAATATTDPAQITAWWDRWPKAAIGVPTGKRSGFIVLDIDTKDAHAYGWDTLDALGFSILPETPMACTPSDGTHIYFACIGVEIRNSAGATGLGPGLDVRGEGGFIVLPTPGRGYRWDPHYNLDTVPLMPAPPWLGHRERLERAQAGSVRRISKIGSVRRLQPATILDDACGNIRRATAGERHEVLNREVFSVATLVAAGALRECEARHALEAATAAMVWATRGDLAKAERDLADAFNDGLAAPRRRAGR